MHVGSNREYVELDEEGGTSLWMAFNTGQNCSDMRQLGLQHRNYLMRAGFKEDLQEAPMGETQC